MDLGLANSKLTSSTPYKPGGQASLLKVQSMVIRNEVTPCLPWVGRYPVAEQRMQQGERLSKKRMPRRNGGDMPTYSRWIGL